MPCLTESEWEKGGEKETGMRWGGWKSIFSYDQLLDLLAYR